MTAASLSTSFKYSYLCQVDLHLKQLVSKTVVTDPIHGNIEMPKWLMKISKEKAFRRIMFIRQLGLKEYVDFPGAIHTCCKVYFFNLFTLK
jgi:hypothetical protein